MKTTESNKTWMQNVEFHYFCERGKWLQTKNTADQRRGADIFVLGYWKKNLEEGRWSNLKWEGYWQMTSLEFGATSLGWHSCAVSSPVSFNGCIYWGLHSDKTHKCVLLQYLECDIAQSVVFWKVCDGNVHNVDLSEKRHSKPITAASVYIHAVIFFGHVCVTCV